MIKKMTIIFIVMCVLLFVYNMYTEKLPTFTYDEYGWVQIANISACYRLNIIDKWFTENQDNIKCDIADNIPKGKYKMIVNISDKIDLWYALLCYDNGKVLFLNSNLIVSEMQTIPDMVKDSLVKCYVIDWEK